MQDGGHIGLGANGNIVFLIAYAISFPKMYSFHTLHKNPAKVHSEPDLSQADLRIHWTQIVVDIRISCPMERDNRHQMAIRYTTYYRNWMSYKWQNYLAFLVFITDHLSNWNLKLQRNNKLLKNVCSNVGSFTVKLELVNLQIRQTTLLRLQTPFTFPKKRSSN